MSHLTQTFNTNAFDVNANQTASISTTEEFFMIRPTSSQAIQAPTVGNQVLIGYGHIINTLSGLTVNTASLSGTTYAQSYTLANDGIYLIKCTLNYAYNNTTGTQGYYINVGTTQISNADKRTTSNIDYPHVSLMSTIIEVSGSSKGFDIRCSQANQIGTFAFAQTWAERQNFLSIKRLK